MRQCLFAWMILVLILMPLMTGVSAGCSAGPDASVAPEEATPVESQRGEEGAPTSASAADPRTDVPLRTSSPGAEATPDELPAEAGGVASLAREDPAQSLDLPFGAIELGSVEAMEWHDARLGCPQPGQI